MAKSFEATHAATVDNLSTLVIRATEMGDRYQPVRDTIQLTALQAYQARCEAAHNGVKTAKEPFERAVNARAAAYDGITKLGTRIVAAFADSNATAADIDDARRLLEKLRGERATPVKKPAPGEKAADTISASQQSFVSIADTFDSLIQKCKAQKGYKGGKPELEIDALVQRHTAMKDANKKVEEAYGPYADALKLRDAVLYEENGGVAEVGKWVRNYMKKDHPGDTRFQGIKLQNLARK